MHQEEARRSRGAQIHRQDLRQPLHSPLGHLGRRATQPPLRPAGGWPRLRDDHGRPDARLRRRCPFAAVRRLRGVRLHPGRQRDGLLGPQCRARGGLVDELRSLLLAAGRRCGAAPAHHQPGMGCATRLLSRRQEDGLHEDGARRLRGRPLRAGRTRRSRRRRPRVDPSLGPLAGGDRLVGGRQDALCRGAGCRSEGDLRHRRGHRLAPDDRGGRAQRFDRSRRRGPAAVQQGLPQVTRRAVDREFRRQRRKAHHPDQRRAPRRGEARRARADELPRRRWRHGLHLHREAGRLRSRRRSTRSPSSSTADPRARSATTSTIAGIRRPTPVAATRW